ncbi:MAG TPA: VTT domain-containing protein [Acidimicrobiales bacterium]|nr:VTT domain-containing protein [Acidimicrobiales bacterium]
MLKSVIGSLSLDPKQIFNSLSPYGEVFAWFIVFAETGLLLGFFLPGDSLLFTAGVLAGQGHLQLWLLLPGAFVGAALGGEVGYEIGYRVGPRIFSRHESRFFKQEYVERTHEFFERHGSKAVLLARFVPVVRTFMPVMAGVGKMTRRVYTIYNLIGALVWAVGVTLLGYVLGNAIGGNIDNYLLPLIAVIILISFVPVFIEWRRTKRRTAAASPDSSATPPVQDEA